MIKINTILNNKEWNNYIKNPSIFVEKKINRINKNFKIIKFFAHYYYLETMKLKNLIKSLEKKINLQMSCLFLSIKKVN